MKDHCCQLTTAKKVKIDKAGIYLGNIFTLETNLELPSKGNSGSLITWESSNENILSSKGKIKRPESGTGNAAVTLTATVSLEGMEEKRMFKVTVLEKEKPKVITELNEICIHTAEGILPQLPPVVVATLDDGSFGTARVQWNSITPAEVSTVRSFMIEGSVSSTDIKAKATIQVMKNSYGEHTSAGSSDNGAPAPRIPAPRLKLFDMKQVTLDNSLFSENRDRMHEYLLSQDDDQKLYNFRTTAGLDTKNAKPMDGWDAPDSNLRGHTTGHYLSALALAYTGSGSLAFKHKIDYMTTELGKCQDAMATSGQFGYGFLSSYSEEQFDKLEELTTYPTIWAPYYTLHKIVAGLLDCFELAGNHQALDIASKIGSWVYNRLGKLDKEKLTDMWALYIAGESGGMNEAMARLYMQTEKQEHLTAALLFDNSSLFIPMADNIDTLGGIHANQHIPQIIGAMQIYCASGEEYYYRIAKNFWEMVVGSHIYNIGGTGSGEMFKQANKIARFITDKTAETCATYNMLKLTRDLFQYNPQPKYMDYYERGLYNHIAASLDKSGPSGGSTYFMPLYPGSRREYDVEGNSCCHGTGMENHTRYQESIYFYTPDETSLYVNLYIPSTLDWKEKSFTLTQSGNFLAGQPVSLLVEGSGRMILKLRVPFWIEKGFTVKINGTVQNLNSIPGSYVEIDRIWGAGDRLEIELPLSFRYEPTPDDPAIGSIMYGPLVMACLDESDRYLELSVGEQGIESLIQPGSDQLSFLLDGKQLVPNYTIQNEPCHTYFALKSTVKA